MNAGDYTSERPLWYVDAELLAGENVTYQYVRQEDCGQAWIFESVNRTLKVPDCKSSETVGADDAWTGEVGVSGNC